MSALLRWVSRHAKTSYLLTTRGRHTGADRVTPVNLVCLDGERFLVSPYGRRGLGAQPARGPSIAAAPRPAQRAAVADEVEAARRGRSCGTTSSRCRSPTVLRRRPDARSRTVAEAPRHRCCSARCRPLRRARQSPSAGARVSGSGCRLVCVAPQFATQRRSALAPCRACQRGACGLRRLRHDARGCPSSAAVIPTCRPAAAWSSDVGVRMHRRAAIAVLSRSAPASAGGGGPEAAVAGAQPHFRRRDRLAPAFEPLGQPMRCRLAARPWTSGEHARPATSPSRSGPPARELLSLDGLPPVSQRRPTDSARVSCG